MDNDCGLIVMSNPNTKQECITRQCFGIPASQAGYVEKVKTGMLVFILEQEERKLYGVFEATSDSALNISTGKPFPAQILCNRIWMCEPLLEDEFRDAIKENYYTTQKFHFGLSSEQVYRLLDLFYSKKIPVLNEKPGIPNKVIQAFEKSSFVRAGEPCEGSLKRFHSDAINTDSTIGSSSPDCFSRVTRPTIYDKRHELTLGYSLPYSALPNHQVVQGYRHELYSAALDIHPSLAQQYTDCIKSNVNSINQLHPSPSNSLSKLPSKNYDSHKVHKESSLRCPMPSQASPTFGSSQSHANLHEYTYTTHFIKPRSVTKERISTPYMDCENISDGCAKSSQEEVWRGRQYLDTGSSGFSLSPEDGLVQTSDSSELVNIPPKDEFDAQDSSSSESEEQNKDLKPLILANSKFHSDFDLRRTSALSRLSTYVAPEPSHRVGVACKQEACPSQLLESQSAERDKWSISTEVETTRGIQVVNKPFIGISGTEQSDVAALSSCEIHSDTSLRRTSAFSRLSTCMAPERFHQDGLACKQETCHSQLLEKIFDWKDQWYMRTEVEPVRGIGVVKKPCMGISRIEQSDVDALSSCEIHSDTNQRRTSAFSRLSPYASEPSHQEDVSCKQETCHSQLLERISVGREQVVKKPCKQRGRGQSELSTVSDREIHSDTDQRRTSAFSRLSTCVAPKPFHQAGVTCKQEMSHSQLMEIVYEGREKWSLNTEIEPMRGVQTVKKKCVDISRIGKCDVTALSSCKTFPKVGSRLPFSSFKRRTIHTMEDGTETKAHAVSEEAEGKHRRRRLVRPSFSEEEHEPPQVTAQNGADVNARSILPKIESAEIAGLSGCDYSLGHIGTANSVDDRHQDSIRVQANASETIPEGKELKVSNASEAVSNCEASFLPVQFFAQHGLDKNAQSSPPEMKSDENVDASPKSCSDATLDNVDDGQGSRCSWGGELDATPTWIRLKSIIARAKTSGTDPRGKEHKESNASFTYRGRGVELSSV